MTKMETSAVPLPDAPGTFAHSVRIATLLTWNDLRQGFRKHGAGATWRERTLQGGGILFGLLFFAGLHLAAFSLITFTGLSKSADKPALMAGLSTSIWCFLLFVMISGGLVRALVVLHEQDDSNLLLSSPVAPRAILASRLFGNALQSCLVDGFIIIPWIDIRVFMFGHIRFLWGFPVWFALAVIVTCIDGLFSFGMVSWLGLRKARLFSQAIPFALIFGVTFFAGSLSISIAQMNMTADQTQMPPTMQAYFIALSHTPLDGLALAATGHPAPLLIIFGTAAGLALITLRLTERAFIEGTQNLSESTASAPSGQASGPFRSSVMLLEIQKNVRMVTRTPMMVVQCLAQVLTPIGIAFVLGRDDLARGVSFFVIFASGVLAGMLTIAAGTVEECDDLLVMSPRPELHFRLGKMLSGCALPCGVALLVGFGLAVSDHLLFALAVVLGAIPLALSSSLIGETFAIPVRPGARPKLLSNPIMMIPLLGMQIISGLVAGVTVFAASFSGLFLLAALGISYFVLVAAIGLAQLRKPLLS